MALTYPAEPNSFRNSFSVFTKHNPPTDPDKQSHQGRIYLQFQEDGQAQAFLEGVGQESTYRITS
ncbi:hypothetical protein PGTUg99_032935 [Puccinia graminis f. sp. tritici]|uniref:Uncharacterized protein n=1 Tax=Puccinia graminis f. sp. tritici TaxID=56615 RepID=A0A5B0S8H6_PUCGR|nr:hypothetical protein PGTUg99_032935 [Puccinia graminis f. sp. tritici]